MIGAIVQADLIDFCAQQTGPTPDEIVSFRRKELPATDKGKCLLACVLEGKGLLKKGKFDANEAQRIAGRVYPNNFPKIGQIRHVLNHCGAVASNQENPCNLAFKLADCVAEMVSKNRFLG